MSTTTIKQKVYLSLFGIVLFLSTIALIAELLPEVKAKMIVIPTLILIITLCSFQIYDYWKTKK